MNSEHYQDSPFQENPDEFFEEIKQESTPIKRESLGGLWKDLNVDITNEDIDAIRREMWANFPRDDI